MDDVDHPRRRFPRAGEGLGAIEPIYYRTDGPYAGSAPCFYDPDEFPWAARMTAAWRSIRQEYEDNVRRGSAGVTDVFNPAGPAIPGWTSVNFQTYHWRYHRPWAAFPVTGALLESIPGLTSAFVNVLAPGARIPAHCGDSNVIVRFHLGLDVPAGDCAIRVGPETRRCADGALLAFCDAHEHASWNATGARRVVLVFDVLLPEHVRRAREICANVLGATVVIWLEKTLTHGRPLRRGLRTGLRRTLAWVFRAWLPIQRCLGRQLGRRLGPPRPVPP